MNNKISHVLCYLVFFLVLSCNKDSNPNSDLEGDFSAGQGIIDVKVKAINSNSVEVEFVSNRYFNPQAGYMPVQRKFVLTTSKAGFNDITNVDMVNTSLDVKHPIDGSILTRDVVINGFYNPHGPLILLGIRAESNSSDSNFPGPLGLFNVTYAKQ
jgi:hypothetical protein